MMRKSILLLAIALLPSAGATETLYYRYDALGRLNQAFSDKTGYRVDYSLDAADNRTQVTSRNINTIINTGQSIQSPDGRFSLVMQNDGNLVLYGPTGALWNTATTGGANVADMQPDGNFVVYTTTGQPIWDSKTPGHPASVLALQNDGNLVIYDAANVALWSSSTGAL